MQSSPKRRGDRLRAFRRQNLRAAKPICAKLLAIAATETAKFGAAQPSTPIFISSSGTPVNLRNDLLKSPAEPDFPDARKFANPRRVFGKSEHRGVFARTIIVKLRRFFAAANHFFGARFVKRQMRAASQIRFAQTDFLEHFRGSFDVHTSRPNANRKPARFRFRESRTVQPRRSSKTETPEKALPTSEKTSRFPDCPN